MDFRATANFSSGGSSLIDLTVGGTPGTGDSFLHFAVPGGQSITSLTVTYLDDLQDGVQANVLSIIALGIRAAKSRPRSPSHGSRSPCGRGARS